jgi:hypothetical protein
MVYVAGARGVWQRPGTPGSGRETRLQHFQSIFGGARGLDQPFRGDLERLLFCDLPLLIRWGITILGRMSDPSESPETQIPRSAEDAAEASPPRERAFNLPAVVLAAIIACIAIHLLRAYALTVEHNIDVIGEARSSRFVTQAATNWTFSPSPAPSPIRCCTAAGRIWPST